MCLADCAKAAKHIQSITLICYNCKANNWPTSIAITLQALCVLSIFSRCAHRSAERLQCCQTLGCQIAVTASGEVVK